MTEWMKLVPEDVLAKLHGACLTAAQVLEDAQGRVFWALDKPSPEISERAREYRFLANEFWEEREGRHS